MKYLITLFLSFSITVFSQDASQILNSLSEKTKSYKNISIDFDIKYENELEDIREKKSGKIIESLEPYFEKQTCLFAAIYAGLTTMPLVYISWKFGNNLIQSITLAFVIGYIADIAIDKY